MKVGEAFVEVRPDTAGFARDADNQIGGALKKLAKGAAVAFAVGAVKEFLGGAIGEAQEAAKAMAQTEAVIKSTGKAAKVSAKDVGDLAEALSKKAGIDDELIQSGANVLLTFTKVRNEVGKNNDIFDQATAAALDMSVALGTDMKGAAILVGKALNDPIKGVTALTRSGVQFTEQQKEQIKTMVANGDAMGAQKIILAELTTQFGGSAAAQATASDKLRVSWGNLQEKLGTALLPVLNQVVTALDKFLPVIEPLLPILVPMAAAIAALVVVTKTWVAVQTAVNVVLGRTAIEAVAANAGMASLNGTMGASAGVAGAARVGVAGLVTALGVGLGVVLHNLIESKFPAFNRTLEKFGGWMYDHAIGPTRFFKSIWDSLTNKTITLTVEERHRAEGKGGSFTGGGAGGKGGGGGSVGARASGGPVWPGQWLVGERRNGAELLSLAPGSRGYVTNARETERVLAGSGGSQGVGPITVELVVDGTRFSAAIVDPMADALIAREKSLR